MSEGIGLQVLVTGARGNLGRKLIADLVRRPWCRGVLAVDLAAAGHAASSNPLVETIGLDLAVPSAELDAAVARADAIVHLAAKSPYPDASWADGATSFDMTLNLAEAATRAPGRPMRFVFASSNHVMGGYKDDALAPGALTTDLPPRPGTPAGPGDTPRAYAAAKLMGERLLAAKAATGVLTAVSLRIGWCQPGDNHPRTLSAAGVPDQHRPVDGPDSAEPDRDLAWYRGMWLSDRDFVAAVAAALTADAAAWPAPAIVVNTMSANRGAPWDLAATRTLIGYAPQDDVWRVLGA